MSAGRRLQRRTNAASIRTQPGGNANNPMLSPSQLGYNGSLGNLFGGNKTEAAPFKGEPHARIPDPAAARLPDAVAELRLWHRAEGIPEQGVQSGRRQVRRIGRTRLRRSRMAVDRRSARHAARHSLLRDIRRHRRGCTMPRLCSRRTLLPGLLQTGHDAITPLRRFLARRAALDLRVSAGGAPRPDHGHVRAARQLHPRQRPAGRGDPRSPHAGRHADDLVQGRLRRRDARQIRPRAFPRASDVQGHGEASGRRILPDRAAGRRQRERLHLRRLHRLLPARAARAARHA